MDDLFINLSSQLATGYDGDIINYTKIFNAHADINLPSRMTHAENCDLDKRSQRNVPIVHNLEAHDAEIILYIVSNINLGEDYFQFLTLDNPDGTTAVAGIKQGRSWINNIVIPETIDGKTVTSIAPYAFTSNGFNQGVTSVTVPKTVTTISEYAFMDSDLLTEVKFADDSNLEAIGPYAFANSSIYPQNLLQRLLMTRGTRRL
jgi:hypothetical protein